MTRGHQSLPRIHSVAWHHEKLCSLHHFPASSIFVFENYVVSFGSLILQVFLRRRKILEKTLFSVCMR